LLVSGPVAQEKQGIWMISIIGASLKKIRDDAHQASLSPDGSQIIYLDTETHAIWIMNVDGSQARQVIAREGDFRVFSPTWFANGKRILYVKVRSSNDNPTVMLESRDLQGKDPQVMLENLRLGEFSFDQPGRLVYSLSEPPPHQYDTNLWDVQYDLNTGKPKGSARQITDWDGFTFSSFGSTTDGKHFVFVNRRSESAVYLGELASGGNELKSPQRLTLNQAINWPGGWSPDSKSVVFSSNRDNSFNIYAQGAADRSAHTIASGPEQQLAPIVTADGKWVLYIQWPKADATTLTVKSGKLMRVPVGGGAPETVMDVEGSFTLDSDPATPELSNPTVRCPRQADADCVIGEVHDKKLTFSSFDPFKGRKKLLTTVSSEPDFTRWDLSPDGTKVAASVFDFKRSPVEIVPLDGGVPQKIAATPWTELCAIAWAADGKSLFLASYSSRGTAIVHTNLAGNSKLLFKPSWDIFALQPSPDGKSLAFGPIIANANAWTMGSFPTK
jgi:Tol biopolymer transport system component